MSIDSICRRAMRARGTLMLPGTCRYATWAYISVFSNSSATAERSKGPEKNDVAFSSNVHRNLRPDSSTASNVIRGVWRCIRNIERDPRFTLMFDSAAHSQARARACRFQNQFAREYTSPNTAIVTRPSTKRNELNLALPRQPRFWRHNIGGDRHAPAGR